MYRAVSWTATRNSVPSQTKETLPLHIYRPRFSLPRGRSRMTILLLFLGPFGPGFRVRTPFATQPQTDRGCLLPFDFPRPPP